MASPQTVAHVASDFAMRQRSCFSEIDGLGFEIAGWVIEAELWPKTYLLRQIVSRFAAVHLVSWSSDHDCGSPGRGTGKDSKFDGQLRSEVCRTNWLIARFRQASPACSLLEAGSVFRCCC